MSAAPARLTQASTGRAVSGPSIHEEASAPVMPGVMPLIERGERTNLNKKYTVSFTRTSAPIAEPGTTHGAASEAVVAALRNRRRGMSVLDTRSLPGGSGECQPIPGALYRPG